MTMDVLSDFIGQNYFWILIIGLFLIMALIGFIADKKNLVKLETSPSKEDKEDDNSQAMENLPDKPLADVVYESSVDSNLDNSHDTEQSNIVEPIITDSKQSENPSNSDNIASPIDGVPAELFAPIGDSNSQAIPSTVSENNKLESNVSDDSLNKNMINGMEIVNFDVNNEDKSTNVSDSVSDVKSTEVENENNNGEINSQANLDNPIDVDLPDLNSTEEENSDDIWKF